MACSERESLERQIRFLSGLIQKHKTDHSLSGHFTNCTFRRVNSSGLPKPVGPNRFSLINHPGITCTQLPERKNSAFEKLKAIKTARRAAGNRLTLLQQHRNIITTTSPGNAVKNPGEPVEKLQHRSSEAIRRLIPATESIEKLLPKVVLSSAHKITTRSPQAQLVVMPTSSCPSKPNLPTCSVVPSNNNVKQSLYVFTNDKKVYEKACFAPLSGKAMHSKFRVTKDKVVHDLTVAAARTSSPSKGSSCSSPVLQARDGRLGTLGTKPFQNVETSTPLASKTCRTLKSEYVWTADAARADSSPVGTMSKVKSIAHDVHMLSPILSLPSHQNKSPESPNCSPVKHSLQRESVHIKSSSKLLSGAGLSHHSSSGCSAKYSTSSSHSAQPLMSRYRWKAVSPRSRISAGSPSTASVQTRLSLTVPRSVYKVKSRTKIVKRKILNTTAQGGSIGTSTLRGQSSRSQPKIYCTISKHKIRKLPFSRTPSQGKRGGRAKKSQVYVNQKGIHYSASHRGRTLQRIRSPRTESGRPVGGKGFVRSPPVSALELSHSRRLASQALQRSLMVARQAQLRRNKTKEYCIFYNRFGKCNRGEECRYIHDPDKIAVCTRFIRGTCKKTDASCQFSHKVTKEKMPVCRYYIRGMCNNSDCMYSHVKVSRKAGVCEDFVKGYCPLGAKCKKEHTLECSEFVASGKCPHGATCRLHHPHTRKHKCKAIVPEEGLAHMKKKVRGNGARPSISGKTSKDPVTSGACVRSRGQQDEDKMSSCNNIGRLPSYIALDESSLPETQAPEPHLAEKAVQSGQALHIKPRF